jgi:hypothetical protein
MTHLGDVVTVPGKARIAIVVLLAAGRAQHSKLSSKLNFSHFLKYREFIVALFSSHFS